ncbi:protoporphyrinogen/coproporphyrinogen oxidase [Streptomyces sp. WMMC897]|uniref:protoporphyrinogen/coproporphyrinogen oxidase n=1 Tax=Streptomyces sp. WMMC897 TaxID=3014782 RepID=UPI0022B62BC4|nr:NAD(P)/FAD-dependent oxidoreductase [Streptomyces sp. WMMC897]MCZ7414536.1 NAD(P)/FAD-dependent oxidoreductase [Streptomyces sp. WMMC897]
MADLDVAVVGAGISGLVTAWRLAEQGHRVEVFESEPHVGGRMHSRRVDGYTVDHGAETLAPFGYPATWELIRELGLDRSGQVSRIRPPVALWRDGKAHPWLGHPLSALTGAGLSARGRLQSARLLGSAMLKSRSIDQDAPESSPYGLRTLTEVGEEYGAEAMNRVLAPMAASAFGWLPERSAAAPLIAIVLATKGVWRWRTYRDGQDTMARALGDRLTVHLSKRVTEVKREGAREARLRFADGTDVSARAAVLTMPSPQIPALHPEVPEEEREFLEASTFTRVMRVALLLDRPLEPRRGRFGPRLYAALMAEGASPLLAGCTVEHNKCGARVPRGAGMVSLLVSPRRVPEFDEKPDAEVAEAVIAEGGKLIDGLRSAVVGHDVIRWRHALPEAPPQALALRRRFLDRPAQPVEYAGDWLYLRPSSEAAIGSARLAVPRVRAWLDG